MLKYWVFIIFSVTLGKLKAEANCLVYNKHTQSNNWTAFDGIIVDRGPAEFMSNKDFQL